jgi:hypothetical protein
MKTINELIDKASKAKFSSEDEPDYIHVNDVRALMVEFAESCPTPHVCCVHSGQYLVDKWKAKVKGE